MTTLTGEGLTVRRGGGDILKDASLRFDEAGFTAVIGANGAGKSTLLRCLAGLLAPDAGTVSLDDRPLSAWSRRTLARSRAYLPQNPRVEWPISVERLVALGLTPTLPAFGPLPAAMRTAVLEALRQCDLQGQAEQAATTLSGGELARAMLARTLVSDPAVMIVDEPTTGLDARHALDVMARLKALGARGRLVIASVHDLTLAARYADRVVALSGGRVVADGPTAQVLTSTLMAEVFGVRARVSQSPEGLRIDLAGPI